MPASNEWSPPTSPFREYPLLTALSVALITLSLGLPSLTYPFGFDQSNQAFIAYRVLTGEVLYRDVPSLKPPLTTLFHALSQVLFGHSMTAVRIADLLWTVATAVFLGTFAHLASGAGSRSFLLWTGVFYAHFYYFFNYWHTAQVDGWMNLPLSLAMVLVLVAWKSGREKPGRAWACWIAIGVLAAGALLFKYSAAAFLLLFGLASLIPPRPTVRSAVTSASGYLLGLGIALALLAGVLAAFGALDGFLQNHLSSVAHYAGQAPKSAGTASAPLWSRAAGRLFGFRHPASLAPLLPRTYFLGVAGALLAIAWIAVKRHSWRARCLLLLLGWAAAGWASTAAQGRFFGYHYLPLVAPWSVLAAFFVGTLTSAGRPPRKAGWPRALAVTAAVAVLYLTSRGPFWNILVTHQDQLGHLKEVASPSMTLKDSWRSPFFLFTPSFSVRDTVDVSDYLLEHTEPGDSLFVWGSNSAVYFLTRRPRVSGITTSFQAVNAMGFREGAGGVPELLEDFRRTPPRVLLVQHGDEIPHIFGHWKDSFAMLRENRELFRFVNQNYDRVSRQGSFDVFSLREGGGR